MRQGVSQVHEGRIHRQLPIADRSVISLDQMRQRMPPRNRVLRNHIPKGHGVQVSSRSQRLVRRVALVIKEDSQGVLETLKTQEQLSHHRGVFAQIHLTSTLRIAWLTRKSTFYINAVQPSNHPNPLKRQTSRKIGFAQNPSWKIGSSFGACRRLQTDDGAPGNNPLAW